MTDSGSRIYKKCSSNQKITTYLGKRDYIDHITHTEPIDGVVLLDPDYVKNKKVFVKLVCAFRYGREDLDVLGLKFRKDFISSKTQIYPKPDQKEQPYTNLQNQLLIKLGDHAYPFNIEIPKDSPCSVNLQPAENDKDKSCGIDYRLISYVAEDGDEDKAHKKSSVQLVIRKVQFAPDMKGPQPSAEVQKEFLLSDRPLSMEISLDKDLYYHGETVNVNVQVTNTSSKTVKKIRVAVRQVTNIYLFSSSQYNCVVAEIETDDQVAASSTLCKVYEICPLLSNNKDKCGLALDGKLKHEDTNLASSTLIKEGVEKENLGIVVQYIVKVRLTMSGLASEVSAEVPLQLMHPKPSEE